jgi:hypothetical protein
MGLYDGSMTLSALIDPTVKRQMQNSLWVFDIMLAIPHSLSVECTELKALGSVDRRTHIFMNNINPASLNNVAITVIKDQ